MLLSGLPSMAYSNFLKTSLLPGTDSSGFGAQGDLVALSRFQAQNCIGCQLVAEILHFSLAA